MTPLMAESKVSLDLLREAGYRYVLDWPVDDQPIWMQTRSGQLLNVPYPTELNDYVVTCQLNQDPLQYTGAIVRQFEELIDQCEKQPLVFSLALHTMISGQPHRLRSLRDALRRIFDHPKFDRVWLTLPGEIAAFCETLPAGTIPGDTNR
jgi:hypothetical protein